MAMERGRTSREDSSSRVTNPSLRRRDMMRDPAAAATDAPPVGLTGLAGLAGLPGVCGSRSFSVTSGSARSSAYNDALYCRSSAPRCSTGASGGGTPVTGTPSSELAETPAHDPLSTANRSNPASSMAKCAGAPPSSTSRRAGSSSRYENGSKMSTKRCASAMFSSTMRVATSIANSTIPSSSLTAGTNWCAGVHAACDRPVMSHPATGVSYASCSLASGDGVKRGPAAGALAVAAAVGLPAAPPPPPPPPAPLTTDAAASAAVAASA